MPPLNPPPSQDLFNWTSPFITGLQDANNDFLAFISSHPTTNIPDLANLIAHVPSSKGGFGLRDPSAIALPLMLISFTRTLQMAIQGLKIGNRQDRLPMTPAFAATFQAWLTSSKRPFALFRTYAPLLLQGYSAVKLHKSPQINSVADILQLPLQALSPKLYDHHTSTQLEVFTDPETNPQDAALFPSIMSTFTSFPLTLYHRQHPHNRLSNHTFQTLLQRKLRLPLSQSPMPLTGLCPLCSVKQLDPYGDHLLCCQKISKTAFHNTVRNTLCHVCKKLAPQANFVSHPTAISIETPIANTTLLPADVGIGPLPDALQTTPLHPIALLALDVTITSSPLITDRPSPPISPISKVHIDAQRRKLYCHQHTPSSTGHPSKHWVQLFLQQGILRIPFSVDPFLGLGLFAHRFLFGNSKISPPNFAHPHNHFSYPEAQQSYDLLTQSAPQALLPKANSAYRNSIDTFKPSQWATRCLALNMSTALTQHIQRAFTLLQTTSTSPATVDPHILGYLSPTAYTTTILDPLPHYISTQDYLD